MSGRARIGRRRRAYGRRRFPKDREWRERRGRRKRSKTKAEVRREFRKHIREALSLIAAYNRGTGGGEGKEFLGRAVDALERALEIRPGQHLLRRQRDLCLEESRLALEGRRGGAVEVVLDEAP